MILLRLLFPCVNDMSTMSTLGSSGGFTWVRGTSDVIVRIMLIVWSRDAAAGFGVSYTVACSDGVATT